MNGYKWRPAAVELAELVRTVTPWVAYLGAVVVAVVALTVFARTPGVLPG